MLASYTLIFTTQSTRLAMIRCLIIMLFALSSTQLYAMGRWVTPPAAQVIDGPAIVIKAEKFDDTDFIIHLQKPKQVDWRETRYTVNLARTDDQPFNATLATRAFVKDDEVVFLSIPKGSSDKYTIEVIDQTSYPFTRVFKGTIESIDELK